MQVSDGAIIRTRERRNRTERKRLTTADEYERADERNARGASVALHEQNVEGDSMVITIKFHTQCRESLDGLVTYLQRRYPMDPHPLLTFQMDLQAWFAQFDGNPPGWARYGSTLPVQFVAEYAPDCYVRYVHRPSTSRTTREIVILGFSATAPVAPKTTGPPPGRGSHSS